jgi:hypothetical protein
MAATNEEIRAGLQTRLDTIAGVNTSAYPLDSPPDLTLEVMGTEEIEYDLAMHRGLDRMTWLVRGISGSPDSRAAMTNLDTWLDRAGATSVKAAVEGDITLGGIVESARVMRSTGQTYFTLPNRGDTLGTLFYIDVYNVGN